VTTGNPTEDQNSRATESRSPAEPKASVAKRTQKALPFSVASAALRLVLALASMVLLVRYLPREEYGVWILLAGLADPVSLLSAFGYRNALNRFIPAIEDPRERAHLVWSVFVRRSLFAIAISLGLVAGFDLFAKHIGIEAYESQFRIVQIVTGIKPDLAVTGAQIGQARLGFHIHAGATDTDGCGR
jgi:O-antigen/teichoic acid export membrane protein